MREAFATSVASDLVSKLGEYLIAPIGRQFRYVLCYKSYFEDLESGVKELEIARERVQHSVDEAQNNGKLIDRDVVNWLESVKEETEKAENLLKPGRSAKYACFRGWLPNPVVLHPISRKVRMMTQVIRELHENSPIGVVIATTSAARFVDKNEVVLESRALIMGDIVKAIADDNVSVIGVYGPGGVGKSKLLKDVERRIGEEELFDIVVSANVSRNPDLTRIQGEIAFQLGLNIKDVETTRGRAHRLINRLENCREKKILIILDDMWGKLELNEVGIPYGEDSKVRSCKLLLTSRDRDVLRFDMDSDLEFRLNELEHGEARRLFEMTAGDRVNDPEFKPLVDGVVKNCEGLPRSIVSLAKRLKHGDLAEWSDALTSIE